MCVVSIETATHGKLVKILTKYTMTAAYQHVRIVWQSVLAGYNTNNLAVSVL